ncbi:MAG: zinc metalloprotease HtpX [Zestosphaera tikiterensis]|uniref:Protease HtpX homolog n=1 Tax=Zestosphaera tikiterensis TaxID=1973259 RepID=A0A2R7Y7U2_9CREN|nr:MAG: zinc metalloprotease HtpX [Zestosphaera tikiterensis]
MSALVKLRLSMLGIMALVIGIATLLVTAIMYALMPETDFAVLIYGSLAFIVLINVMQWLIGPKIIEAMYRVRPLKPHEYGWLVTSVERVAKASGLKKVPNVGIAEVSVPNAFAYGNLVFGYKVAVTRGLLEALPPEEVEAVIAHEVGHIRHRDVEVMMLISILPALLYWLGRTLIIFGGFGYSDRRRQASFIPVLAGFGLFAVSFLMNFFVLYISRLREHYADSNAVLTVDNGGRKLQRALARILIASGQLRNFRPSELNTASKLKAFLISDPEVGIAAGFRDIDSVVEWIKSRPRLSHMEIFSTHPDPAKRFRFIDSLEKEIRSRRGFLT